MTDSEHTTAAKKRLADERAARDKANEAQAKMATGIKPTPTQEENDMAAMGVHIIDHEHDGSPELEAQTRQSEPAKRERGSPDHPNEPQTKHTEAAKHERGGYQTRATTPAT